MEPVWVPGVGASEGQSRSWDVPWSNASRCFPCLLFMLEQAKGADRVRDGSEFALIFLLWLCAWATDSTKKSFPV